MLNLSEQEGIRSIKPKIGYAFLSTLLFGKVGIFGMISKNGRGRRQHLNSCLNKKTDFCTLFTP